MIDVNKDQLVPVATSRRQFTALLCAGGAIALTGCGGGSAAAPEPVIVLPPQIVLQPQALTADIGQTATLRVEASGTSPAYQWRRNGVAIAGANASTLVLVVQATDHEARFSVQVSNQAGSVTSAEAELTLPLMSHIRTGINVLAGQIGSTDAAQDSVGELARFGATGRICSDSRGNLYVVDTSNSTLRKVTPFGVVTTLLRDFPSDSAVAVDAQGNYYGVRNRTIVKVAPDGAQSVLAGVPGVLGYADGPGAQATFAKPNALAIDSQGNLLVADAAEIVITGNVGPNLFTVDHVFGGTVRKILSTGVVSTVAGTIGRTISGAASFGVDGAHVPASVDRTSDLLQPNAIACDQLGNIYVSDWLAANVKRFDAAGRIEVLATGYAESLYHYRIGGLVLAGSEGLYYHDAISVHLSGPVYTGDRVVLKRVGPSGVVEVVAGGESDERKLGSLPGAFGSEAGPTRLLNGLAAGPGRSVWCCWGNAVLLVGLS